MDAPPATAAAAHGEPAAAAAPRRPDTPIPVVPRLELLHDELGAASPSSAFRLDVRGPGDCVCDEASMAASSPSSGGEGDTDGPPPITGAPAPPADSAAARPQGSGELATDAALRQLMAELVKSEVAAAVRSALAAVAAPTVALVPATAPVPVTAPPAAAAAPPTCSPITSTTSTVDAPPLSPPSPPRHAHRSVSRPVTAASSPCYAPTQSDAAADAAAAAETPAPPPSVGQYAVPPPWDAVMRTEARVAAVLQDIFCINSSPELGLEALLPVLQLELQDAQRMLEVSKAVARDASGPATEALVERMRLYNSRLELVERVSARGTLTPHAALTQELVDSQFALRQSIERAQRLSIGGSPSSSFASHSHTRRSRRSGGAGAW